MLLKKVIKFSYIFRFLHTIVFFLRLCLEIYFAPSYTRITLEEDIKLGFSQGAFVNQRAGRAPKRQGRAVKQEDPEMGRAIKQDGYKMGRAIKQKFEQGGPQNKSQSGVGLKAKVRLRRVIKLRFFSRCARIKILNCVWSFNFICRNCIYLQI